MKDFLIRKAEIKDIEEIFRMGSAAKEFFVSEKTGGFWSPRQLKNIISSKDDLCLLAVYKNKIVGFVISLYNKSTNKVVIENIFIKEELRKKGIGKKLMKNLLTEVLNRYLKRGVVYVMALTRRKNQGFINLMKKLGFIIGYKDWVWIEKEFTNEFPKR